MRDPSLPQSCNIAIKRFNQFFICGVKKKVECIPFFTPSISCRSSTHSPALPNQARGLRSTVSSPSRSTLVHSVVKTHFTAQIFNEMYYAHLKL